MQKQRALVLALLLWLLPGCTAPNTQVQPFPTSTSQPKNIIQTTATAVITVSPTPIIPTHTPPSTVTATSAPSPSPTPKPGAAVTLLQIRMLNALEGWGIGQTQNDLTQHILFTLDGGLSWKDRTPPSDAVGTSEQPNQATAFFDSSTNAWVAYSPYIGSPGPETLSVWRTTDGGKSWENSAALDLSSNPAEFRVLSDLNFIDSTHGSLVVHLGAGMSHDYFAIFTTADGGQTWQRVLDPNSDVPVMACYKSGLAFTSPKVGWLAGDCPGLMPGLFFFHTPDGGTSWSAMNLPSPSGKTADYFSKESIGCGISNFDFVAANTLALTVRCRNLDNIDTREAWLYTTGDNGATWSQHPLPLFFGRLWFDSSDEAFYAGSQEQDATANGAFFQSLNGGQDWNRISSTGWRGTPDFIDPQNGWVITDNGTTKTLVHTTNGGSTWEEIKPVMQP